MKQYIKPDLYYENFELSNHVASCSVADSDEKSSTNATTGENCTYELVESLTYFVSDNGLCDVKYDEFEEYCYQTGIDGYNFFSS